MKLAAKFLICCALTEAAPGDSSPEAHWSYAPVQRPALPAVKDAAFLRNEIDAFVQAALEGQGIAPSPEADRATLIKRVYYDLVGLPPSPEEVDAFLADPSPDAYERLVDRALASPHFGERWGRHWLDNARYADSDGYEKDNARPDAWRYRDWVIDAVNRDLPFDQFAVEQLAGDLLPNATPEQHLATAFHRQTLTNREGGVDQEQYRVEAVFDRTETTGSVWMGLTVGCARCHTHKYDQISQREYYQLFAFFNNGDETTAKVGTSGMELAAFEKSNAAHLTKLAEAQAVLTAARAALEEKLPAWHREIAPRVQALKGRKPELRPLDVSTASCSGGTILTKQPDGSWLASGPHPEQETYTLTASLPPGITSGLRLEVLPHDSLPAKGPGRTKTGNFVVSEINVSSGGRPVPLHSPAADFSQKDWTPAGTIDGDEKSGWAIMPEAGKAHHLEIQFVHPLDGARDSGITIDIGQRSPKGPHGLGCFRLLALAGESEDSLAPQRIRNLAESGPEKWTEEYRAELVDWLARFDPAASAAGAALKKIEREGPKPPLMDVRVIAQRTGKPRATHVLQRGEFLSPGEIVQPGTFATLPAMSARNGGTPDRLDLARWLVSRSHPLTARVAVNQIWAQLFGEGLVRTPGDFGVRGERPSHPELLDWLADEFMARGWSRKTIIRTILTSAAWRRSSAARPDLREIDPLNRLLARQNRVRVEGEIVRDLHLAASGMLTRKIGGPSVYPPLPPEVAALSYADNFKWTQSKGDDLYRRGMYTFFKRTAPYPDLMAFDCPDANVACVNRTVSNTPLQALTTLNSQTFTAAAAALAKRATSEAADDASRLTRAFRLCLGRPPAVKEQAQLLALLNEARAVFAADSGAALKLSGGDAELAAWTTTTRIILNTDEFLTRE